MPQAGSRGLRYAFTVTGTATSTVTDTVTATATATRWLEAGVKMASDGRKMV
jgi:hypothetical protein